MAVTALSLLDKARHCRDMAEELRVKAEGYADQGIAVQARAIADDYERWAKDRERLAEVMIATAIFPFLTTTASA